MIEQTIEYGPLLNSLYRSIFVDTSVGRKKGKENRGNDGRQFLSELKNYEGVFVTSMSLTKGSKTSIVVQVDTPLDINKPALLHWNFSNAIT